VISIGFLEMIVLIVFIKAVADVVKTVMHNSPPGAAGLFERRAGVTEAQLQEALRQIREEMAQLRQSSLDVILTFDSTLSRLDDRLQHLEQRTLGTGAAPSLPAVGGKPSPATLPSSTSPQPAVQTDDLESASRARWYDPSATAAG
jgi:hypothetical protein